MITSVAVQAYLTRIGNLLLGQGFKGIFHDPSISTAVLKNMRVVYDSEEAMTEEWLSDELAPTKMKRKGTTTKDDVRSSPFMALFWKRSSLEPIVRQRYRILDAQEESGVSGVYGKSTVSASFTIACVFVSNKAEAIEDLEEAFAAVFQNTYNMPLTLEYIYNAGEPEKKKTNFTYIQNMGESDLVNFKEGNLFAYSWSAKIFMNYVSEFAWSRVYPVEKVIIDLYDPKGVPLASLDAAGIAHTHDYTADTGEVVKDVPDEPLIAFTRAESHDYASFAITAPYSGAPMPISPEARVLIESAVVALGGEMSLRNATLTEDHEVTEYDGEKHIYGAGKYMAVANMPLSLFHKEDASLDADMLATAKAVSDAIKEATGEDYVVTPMSDGVGE